MAKGKRVGYDEAMNEGVKEEVKEIMSEDVKEEVKEIMSEDVKEEVKEIMSEDVKDEVKEIIEKSPAKVETTVPKTVNGVVVNTLNVNVRRWPDKDSEVVETLRGGDHVVIYGKRGDFYEVSTTVNHRVYISSEYLKEE